MRRHLATAARLFAGDAGARGLAFATVLLCAREIGPAAFGRFALVSGAVGIALLLSDFGITPVLLRRASSDAEPAAVSAAFVVNLASAVAVYVVLVLAFAVSGPGMTVLAAVYGLVLPVQAIESSLEAILLARGTGARVGAIRFAGNMSLAFLVPALVWRWHSPTALAACFLVANLVKLGGGVLSTRGTIDLRRPRGLDVRSLLAESWPFFGAAVASFLYFRVDVFLVRALIGERALGVYAAGYRFVDASILLPGAVAYAFFPGWVRRRADPREMHRVAGLLLALGMAGALVGALAGPWLITSVLGGAYAGSGAVLRILSLSLPVLFLDVMLVWVAYALRRERAVIVIGAVALAVNLAANAALIPVWGVRGAALATVVSELANLAGYLVVLRAEVLSALRATPVLGRWTGAVGLP